MVQARIARLRQEQKGFGLVELLIAMTVLAVGILALVAGYSSGYVALRRATTVSAAAALADKQMERFRSLTWNTNTTTGDPGICLASGSTDSAYAANAPSGTTLANCSTSDSKRQPIQSSVRGPDGHLYRIDTYVYTQTPTGGRTVKDVKVVIRDAASPFGIDAQEESTFDQLTGG
jgi:prepilin-type N-terminal cleavage/methylation domain-containing protein